MNEGDYDEDSRAHWMNITRLWLPWGRPTDAARWESMRELFDTTQLDEIQPLVVERMIGKPYGNMYCVHDGHHRAQVAKERHIHMLLVEIWRPRTDRWDRVFTPQHQIFDRV